MEGRDDQDGAMTEPTGTCDQGAGSPTHWYSCTHILGVAPQTTMVSVYTAAKTSNLIKIWVLMNFMRNKILKLEKNRHHGNMNSPWVFPSKIFITQAINHYQPTKFKQFPYGILSPCCSIKSICMYVCIRVGPEIRPLHRDLQWSIVLHILINPLLILHFEWNVGLYLWGHHNSHLVR
jgi:hypothetical protein